MSMNKREGRKMSVTNFYRNIINEAIEPTQFDADGIAKVKAAVEAAAKRLETLTLDKGGQCYTLEFDGAKAGAKYLKVWKNTKWDGKRNETGRSIWAFVDPNGLLWKPASTSTPAKNFSRGKLEDLKSDEFLQKNKYGF